jgi:hypothetical protein
MKELIEDCLEFLLRTVAGVFILSILIVLLFLALFWPQPEREPLPWLGIVGKDVDSKVVRRHGAPFSKGVLVERVFGNSPADYSNLVAGDFIVKFNNRIVFGEAQLRDMIFDLDPGEKAWMTVYRDGAYYNVMLRLAERPVDNSIPAQAAAFVAAAGPAANSPLPITASATLPHTYRGVCSNCHAIVSNRQASQPNTQLVAGMRRRQSAAQLYPGAYGPGFGGATANFGPWGNPAARMPAAPTAGQLPGGNQPGAAPLTPLEEYVWAGIGVETFNPANAVALGLPPNVTGVQADEVLRGSRGERGGVMAGDLIREINGTQVYDVDSFANLVTAQRLTGGVLLINRSGRSMYVTVPEM